MDRRFSGFSVALLGLALITYMTLALAGIRYGLPHAGRALSYNVDETASLEVLSRMRAPERRYNPYPEFHYTTFYPMVLGTGLIMARVVGYLEIHSPKGEMIQDYSRIGRFFLVGRFLQVLFGVWILALLGWIAFTLGGEKSAVTAVWLMTVCPGFIAASHFSQSNMLVSALSLTTLSCLLLARRRPTPILLENIAALSAGFAFGAKPTGVALIVPLAFYAWTTGRMWKTGIRLAGFMGLAFFIGNPFAFLTPKLFIQAMRRLTAENVDPVIGIVNTVLFPIKTGFSFLLGKPLLLVSFVAVAWAFLRHRQRFDVLLVWIAVFVLSTCKVGYTATSGRTLPMAPCFILLISLAVVALEEKFKRPWIVRAGLLALVAVTLLPALAIVNLRRTPSLQQRSSAWIETHISREKTIGIPRSAYWWSPDIVYESFYHPERMKAPYVIKDLAFSTAQGTQGKPDFIVLSQWERNRCEAWPSYTTPEGCKDFFAWLDGGYEKVQEFPRVVEFGGWTWKRPEYTLYFDDDLWATALMIYQKKPV